MICTKLEKCISYELSGHGIDICDNSEVKCVESSDNRPLVKCEQKSKKYTLKNTLNNHIIVYNMDGGIVKMDASVPEGINKCDYLYIIGFDVLTAVFIELKGEDVPQALRQIYSSLMQYKDVIKKFAHVYGRVIVTSSTPNLKANPPYVNLARLLAKHGGNIKIVERQFVEKDIELGQQ